MKSNVLRAGLLLLAVWAVAMGVVQWARSARPTAEKLTAQVEKTDLSQLPAHKRAKTIASVADDLNRLPFDERREVRMGRKLDTFFRSMTPEEQSAFLDETLPTGFKEMMDSLNKMEPAQRKRFVKRAIDDLDSEQPEGGERTGKGLNDPHVQKIMNEGLKSFYSEASAETKMDVAPLLEQLQKRLQQFH